MPTLEHRVTKLESAIVYMQEHFDSEIGEVKDAVRDKDTTALQLAKDTNGRLKDVEKWKERWSGAFVAVSIISATIIGSGGVVGLAITLATVLN